MLLITGGAGFIGSALVWEFNNHGREDIVVCDRLGTDAKWKNLAKRRFLEIIHPDELMPWLEGSAARDVEAVFHLGARSWTSERDVDFLNRNNTRFSAELFRWCAARRIPFLYASSAGTYGDGSSGFAEDRSTFDQLVPLSPYAFSKHTFDRWALAQSRTPPFWAGLKFFNVYGPNEYHKGQQMSMVYHAFQQVAQHGRLNLFRSYREGYRDGEQMRDFVYVKDATRVMRYLFDLRARCASGLYNVGSGQARTFVDLGKAVFRAMGREADARLVFIDMPESLQRQYQYYTCAPLDNLEANGYREPMTSLEDGITDYVTRYLMEKDAYL